jgi:HlyD family type I secretion membrane fusion protein
MLPHPGHGALPVDGRRWLLWVLLILVAVAVGFATVVRVDEVVSAPGVLVAEEERAEARAPVGGVVEAVLVARLDTVRAGQALVRLDGAEAWSRLERSRREVDQADRRLATLREVLAGLEMALEGGDPLPVSDARAAEALSDWRVAEGALEREQRWRRAVLPEERARAQAQLDARTAASDATAAELRKAEEELAALEGLREQGLVESRSYRGAVSARDAALGRHAEAEARVREAQRGISQLDAKSVLSLAQAQRSRETATARLADEAARVRAAIAEAEGARGALVAERDAAERALDRLTITAPIAGRVVAMQAIAPGDRLDAGQAVCAVAARSVVTAAASFANRDAGRLRAGSLCNVKLDAFPYEEYGAIRGRIEAIALEPQVLEGGRSVYPVRVALARGSVRRGETEVALSPGLTLTVEAVTARPRMISKLFDPVRRLFELEGAGGEAEEPDAEQRGRREKQARRFRSERALADVRALVAFGPRPAGTEAARAARAHIAKQLEALGLPVVRRELVAETPVGPVTCVTLLVRLPAAGGPAEDEGRERREEPLVLLGAHYDTKRLEAVPGFDGANDGASGPAVLLECARVLVSAPTRPEVWFCFFDGAEAVGEIRPGDGLWGSTDLASALAQDPSTAGRPVAVVVADMVGDGELSFTDDVRSTPWLADLLVEGGERLGYRHLFERGREDLPPVTVPADHLPFVRAGIAAAVLSDFDFGGPDPSQRTARNRWWRTSEDRLDRIAPDSLGVSGQVLLEVVELLGARR